MTHLWAPPIEPSVSPFRLRPYQLDALDAVEREHEKAASTLVVQPTGTGKTVEFAEQARRAVERDESVLIVVDRDELVRQTVATVGRAVGFDPTIEQAGQFLDPENPVVVATIQTLRSDGRGHGDRRYSRIDPFRFRHLIIDEAHLSITKRCMEFVEHMRQNPDLRVTGYTATPQAGQRRSMSQLYETVAYRYEIRDAIDDGWLVPIEPLMVEMENLDLRALPSRRGDWSDAELSSLLEDNRTIMETCAGLIEHCRGAPTLVFCAQVAHAQMLSAMLNEQIPGSSRWLSGETPTDDRRTIIDGFRDGRINFLCNCGVLTTGFDAWQARNVAIVRPTKSWSLFVQMCGRGTRPEPGIFDGLDTAEDRKAAIAASAKPRMNLYCFVDRYSGMDLVGPEDVMAGSMRRPEIVARAKAKKDGTVEERLDQAEREIAEEERRRQERDLRGLRVAGASKTSRMDLYTRGVGDAAKTLRAMPASDGQINIMRKFGVEPSLIRKYQADSRTAQKIVGMLIGRANKGLSTWGQCRALRGVGYGRDEVTNLTKDQASALIDRVAAAGWRRVDG